MTGRSLRDYQKECIAYLQAAWAAGIARPPAVLATGLGKTEIFTDPELLDETLNARKRVLIIAHTDELIEQAAKKARRNNPGRRVGIVKADLNQVTAEIIVSSRQTLQSEARRTQIRNLGLIIVDEAHHAVRTNTYGKILEHFGCFVSTEAHEGDPSQDAPIRTVPPKVAGFTATLARGDKAKLSTVWQEPPSGIFRKDVLFGIRHGYLLDVGGKRVVVPDMDMRNVMQRAGDYSDSSIAEELERTFAPEVVAAAYLEHAATRKGIAFWPLVDTAYHGAKAFNEIGIRSEVIHGELPKVERRAMLARLHSGETRVVHGVSVLTEGFDEPTCDVVVVARPTRSAPLYQQMVGRVLRPDLTLPPAERGKALILDVVGAGANHDLRSLIDLAPERKRSDEEEWDDDLSLLEIDEEWIELQEQERSGHAPDFAEDYSGETEVQEFDPLGRSKVWDKTPGGAWYMAAGAAAYAFLVESVEGNPAHFDVVLCAKQPVWPVRPWWAQATEYTDLTLEMALGWAEEVAIEHGGHGTKQLTGRKSAWRNKPASLKALKTASREGAVFPTLGENEIPTAGMVADAIEAAIAARTIDPLVARAKNVVPV